MKKILIFRRGLLGDTIVATAALRCLRSNYSNAEIVLVSELPENRRRPWGEIVFMNSKLIDSVIGLRAYNSRSKLGKFSSTFSLFRQLQKINWDLGIALDLAEKIRWEPMILRMLRAKTILQPPKLVLYPRSPQTEIRTVKHVVDRLIDILRPLGISLPEPGDASMDLNIGRNETVRVERWLNEVNGLKAAKPWIAVSPWSNMPAKQWSTERFLDVMILLREVTGCTPFVFGGSDNQKAAHDFVTRLGFGFPTAGSLDVRQSIALMKRCAIYIGNDSGAMHMAVSAGLRCTAIFSGRDSLGLWHPYGDGHVVLRKRVPCEGCMLRECFQYSHRCMTGISVDEVLSASLHLLRESQSNKSQLA